MDRKRISLCLAHMGGMELNYINEAIETEWVAPLGPNVDAFERDLENYLHPSKRYVLAVSSGTAALHLALLLCGVGAGDEVICSTFTFCASANPILYLGATPVFVDSESNSWNMDPQLLKEAIEDRLKETGRLPKAIVVTHLYGVPAAIKEIIDIADGYSIPLVEDAAEAMGAVVEGRQCGSIGRFGVFSFNGNKMITTSGGGALICTNEEDRRMALYYATQAKDAVPYYQHRNVGYNYRMSNICAGIGRGQMKVLDEHIDHHKRLADYYRQAFSNVKEITYHDVREVNGGESNCWLSTILFSKELIERVEGVENACDIEGPSICVEKIRKGMDGMNVEVRALWKPMHLQPVYQGYRSYINGVSESLFRRGLCLPSGPCVSMDDAKYVVDSLLSIIGKM